MFQASQFWDGGAVTLEDQAKLPFLNPIEMGHKSPDDVVAKLRKIRQNAAGCCSRAKGAAAPVRCVLRR